MTSARLLGLAISAVLTIGLSAAGSARAEERPLADKMNAYVGCINRLSERSYESRDRYFSWVDAKKGPTGKERIIYGTYTIYDTADCKAAVEKANALEPRDVELEAAASAYVEAVTALEPLLKETDDYYQQENYKDDKMAKGKALHPRLVATWTAFAAADHRLRNGVEEVQEREFAAKLAEIEKTEGRKGRYYIQAVMIGAKRLSRAETAEKPDIAKITEALTVYEGIVKAMQAYAEADKDSKIGSMYVSSAKEFLVSAKQLMRRLRDKEPYSQGDRMMLESGGGWMIEGSPDRVMRDYNQLVDAYNRGASF